jgi:hypothetical protein
MPKRKKSTRKTLMHMGENQRVFPENLALRWLFALVFNCGDMSGLGIL